MQNEEKKSIDKSGWGPGPWQDEPDRVEFEAHGLPCLVRRSETTGGLCGYVAVPPGHPWHERGYDDVDADVHGGLTYSGGCSGDICHKSKPGQPDDVRWFGFDCAHCDDLSPRLNALLGLGRAMVRGEMYRDLPYVIQECRRLAEQAKAVQP